jgi:hypothetical protein
MCKQMRYRTQVASTPAPLKPHAFMFPPQYCITATGHIPAPSPPPLQVGVPILSKIPAGQQRGQFLRLVEAKVASGGGGVSIPVSICRQAPWQGSSQAASDTVQV